MGESWASANARMACMDCGESGADPYTTNLGKHVRICGRCLHGWEALQPRMRERLPCEPAENKGAK